VKCTGKSGELLPEVRFCVPGSPVGYGSIQQSLVDNAVPGGPVTVPGSPVVTGLGDVPLLLEAEGSAHASVGLRPTRSLEPRPGPPAKAHGEL
jgi:hypothetical protein